MLEEATVAVAAGQLDDAERKGVPIEQLSTRFPDMTVDDGYRIGRAWVAMKLARGRVVRGHKIGLTSKAMQDAAHIREPDYGSLLDDMFFDEGSDISFDRFIAPLVEVELAFILKRTLQGPGVTMVDVLAATEYVMPAVEIIDSRIVRVDPLSGSRKKIQDTIADNAANAGVVLGGIPTRPDMVDLRWSGAIVARNAVIEETGVAAGVLGHPANGIVWLSRKLARWEDRLEAGEVVLGGSFTRPIEAKRGDVFHADYGRLGSIAFRFI